MQSPSTFIIYKILGVVLLFYLAKASGGTCLSYGHSCWGGHGKRNGLGHLMGSTLPQKRTSEWYISRLFNPSITDPKKIEAILKSQNQDTEDLGKLQPFGYEIYHVSDLADSNREEPTDTDPDSKSGKWNPESKEPEEVVVLSPDVQPIPLPKFRLLQIMHQEERKHKATK